MTETFVLMPDRFKIYFMLLKKKILIIDDDQDILQALESVLDFVDWELKSLASGKSVLDEIRKEQPDLILMDIMLDGGIDGRQICRQVKEDSSMRHISVILISGIAGNAGLSQQDYGPDDFLSKPFSAGDLIDKVYFHLKPGPMPIK